MKTAYRTVLHIRASAGLFIGIPMNAPECSATFLSFSQVTDLVGLIFGGSRSTSSI